MTELKILKQKANTTLLSNRLLVAVLGGVIGVFILLGVGFTNVNLIHNAAHDARHLNSFPCH